MHTVSSTFLLAQCTMHSSHTLHIFTESPLLVDWLHFLQPPAVGALPAAAVAEADEGGGSSFPLGCGRAQNGAGLSERCCIHQCIANI